MGSRVGTDQPGHLSRMLQLGGISSAGRHCGTAMAAGQGKKGRDHEKSSFGVAMEGASVFGCARFVFGCVGFVFRLFDFNWFCRTSLVVGVSDSAGQSAFWNSATGGGTPDASVYRRLLLKMGHRKNHGLQ